MTIAPGALEELHRIHRQLTDVTDRLAAGPKQIKAAEAAVARAEQDLVAAKETYRQTRIAADEKQLQLKQREARLKDLQGKLNAAESNREYQLLKEQIAADQQANSVLTDEILEALESLDQRQADVKTAESNLARIKEELARVRQRVANVQQQLDAELARVKGELAESEKQLPEDFKVEYLRVTKARGENALAAVENECCGHCSFLLTPQTMNELMMQKPVFCKSCGCLLYLLPGSEKPRRR
ncbi:MAG: phospholipase [Pirellulales bacterium]